MGLPLLVTLTFVRAFLLAADKDEANQLVRFIALAGLAYALYSIPAVVIDPKSLLWREKEAYLSNLTGTFVNRNTAATYFGTISILWLLLLLRAVRRSTGGELGVRLTLAHWSRNGVPKEVILASIGLVACMTALGMTGSRAGLVLSLLALAVAGLAWTARTQRRFGGLRALAVMAAVVAVALELLGGLVMGRISTRGFEDISRTDTYWAVLGMIRDHPWLGIGLGQFETVFPAYRSGVGATAGVFDKAHSVPLEIAVELGLPVAAMVLAAWALCAAALVRGVVRRRRARFLTVGGMAVGLLGSLHAIVDFSLQIPGYAVVFAAVTATGLAQAVASSVEESAAAQGLSAAAQGRAATEADLASCVEGPAPKLPFKARS
ncbi:O-antigen ligase family protein [Salinarimonas soli]|uniref:O-antigen ligase domain-containing protein n=1 Tax=Salinarimonas soli TaxID=1638099 RepID=A0A5B2VE52_9HYPH|nr:O-antigen ligase family protein [Salinarimonas soli]KAA2236916.1 O-antigen ligase domain-containing protein [Salinarimonas soli]